MLFCRHKICAVQMYLELARHRQTVFANQLYLVTEFKHTGQ